MFHDALHLRWESTRARIRRSALALAFLLGAGSIATPLSAQTLLPLDESCTVTAGNQTALVRSDGTFLIDNLGIFRFRLGLVDIAAPVLYRVRATCMRDGVMETGQSELFAPVAGSTTFTGPIFASDALPAIPTRIEVTTPESFVTLNGIVQLTVTAHYADGTTRDVSARSEGTTYLTTNPRLLTVSSNGLVTGENRSLTLQTGSITVLNEGNLATLDLLSVGPSNDFDNDGLPNDYELLFGLDRFRNDAFEDLDNDGLTNLEEFQRGTLPNDPDTDLDGVIDGEDGDPLRPESEAPTVTIEAPADGAVVLSGADLLLRALPLDDGRITSIEIFGNGTSLGSLTAPPWETAFSVPFGTPSMTLGARVTDGAGNVADSPTISVAVETDPGTTVTGTVVDTAGTPIPDAFVEVRIPGLFGELFDFETPLTTFPDLGGLTPDATRFVASLGFLNPGQSLSPDTFGLGFDPDFAGRFEGRFRSDLGGDYTVRVGADDGARVSIDDTPVVEVPGTAGGFASAEALVTLEPGDHTVAVEYFQTTAAAELTLALIENGFGGAGDLGVVIGPGPGLVEIRPPASLFATTTGLDGTFSIPAVPTLSPFLSVDVSTPVAAGSSDALVPVRGATTDLGTIVLVNPDQICLTAALRLFSNDCGTEPVSAESVVSVSGDIGDGSPPQALTTFSPDESGRFCVDLPRRRRYFFELDRLDCLGQAVHCTSTIDFGGETTLVAGDAFPPAGSCSTSGCLELETVTLFCDFFGGS
jgi:hypothetical protein